MSFLSRRMWLFAGTVTLFAGGALGVACSNNPGFGDGGPDSSVDSPNGSDAPNNKDGTTGKDSGPGNDGSIVTCDSGVSGSCDIVAQNCGAGKECVVVQATDGGFSLQCQNNTTGSLPEGTDCSKQPNNCVAGLECIQSRCSKHCCFGDDQACGKSVPEGFTGTCNLNITLDNTTTAYSVCAYNKPCEPFQIQGCGPGAACIVQDSNGTSDCSDYSSGTDAGKIENAACAASNDCNDGLGCFGAPDGGGFSCQWACYSPPGPFDAGIVNLGAGKGGCPGAEKCNGVNWNGALPTWLGICGK